MDYCSMAALTEPIHFIYGLHSQKKQFKKESFLPCQFQILNLLSQLGTLWISDLSLIDVALPSCAKSNQSQISCSIHHTQPVSLVKNARYLRMITHACNLHAETISIVSISHIYLSLLVYSKMTYYCFIMMKFITQDVYHRYSFTSSRHKCSHILPS